MEKQNCWEFKQCGREPGGANTASLGICPATTNTDVDGMNCGRNGGRVCYSLAGTLCGGEVQGTFAQKLSNCMKCEFYKKVTTEEGKDFMGAMDVFKKIR